MDGHMDETLQQLGCLKIHVHSNQVNIKIFVYDIHPFTPFSHILHNKIQM